MLQNPNFPRLCPDTTGGAYSAPPDPLADVRELAAPSQEAHPRCRPFGLISTGLKAGMENIVILSKILDIFYIFDIFDIYIVSQKKRDLCVSVHNSGTY